MAKYRLLLPKMGESVAEATIIKWYKNIGDKVELDEAIMDIATDKVDSEVPSPVKGTLVLKLGDENEVIQVGALIAIIETEDVVEAVAPVIPTVVPAASAPETPKPEIDIPKSLGGLTPQIPTIEIPAVPEVPKVTMAHTPQVGAAEAPEVPMIIEEATPQTETPPVPDMPKGLDEATSDIPHYETPAIPEITKTFDEVSSDNPSFAIPAATEIPKVFGDAIPYNIPAPEPLPPVETAAIPGVAQLEQAVKPATPVDEPRFYSPLVRNIAMHEGVGPAELDSIPGTGVDGRLTKDDLLQYLQHRVVPATPAPAEQPIEAPATPPAADYSSNVLIAQEPVTEQPVAEDAPLPMSPMMEMPADVSAAHVHMEQPAVPVYYDETPVAEEPVQEPVAETPAEEPVEVTPSEEPVVEEPAFETQTEEPVVETPTEEPVAEEPVIETPAEEPVAEEPAVETPVVEAPVEEPVAQTRSEAPIVEAVGAGAVPAAGHVAEKPDEQPPETVTPQTDAAPLAEPTPVVAATPVAEPEKPAPIETKTASISGGDEIIEMDRMRRLIADHMTMSVQTSAHVTSFVEVDVTNIVLWRQKNKDAFEKREGTKITYTPIFIQAVARAIKDMPMINISVKGTQIIKKKDINIGMATALPNGNLIVPVIKKADELSLVGLTKVVNDLAGRARNNKLLPDDVREGTFTITNVGTFGNVMGTPIINQPQVAIMAIGAIKKKPAVIETPSGDVIAIRHMMFLSMSYDHRVVDGSLGGSFIRKVADYLESWEISHDI